MRLEKALEQLRINQAMVFGGICLLVMVLIFSGLWHKGRENYLSSYRLAALLDVEKDSSEHLLHFVSLANENSSSLLTITGLGYYQQGNYSLAVAYLAKATKLNPDRITLWAFLGDALLGIGDEEGAIAAWKSVHAELLPYWRGVLAHREGNYEEAIHLLSISTKVEPNSHSYVYTLLGDDYRYTGTGKLNDASDAYHKAALLEKDPYQAALFNGLAVSTVSDWDNAIQAYELAQSIDPNKAEPFYRIGHILYWELGEIEKSIELLTIATSLEPQNPIPYVKLIQIYTNEQDYESADGWFQKANAIIPNDLTLLYYEAVSQMQRGDYSQVIYYADQILALNENYHLIWDLKGKAFVFLNRLDDAELAFYKASLINPYNAIYHLHLSQVYLALDKQCEALDEATIAEEFGEDMRDVITGVDYIRSSTENDISCSP